MAGHRFPDRIGGASALEKEIRHGSGGTCRRRTLYDSGLWNFSSGVRCAQYQRRPQPLSCAPLDEHELRLHQFCMDLAMDIQRPPSFCMVAAHSALVVLLPHAR